MKLQQLRYLLEIEKQALNISKAACSLCTSQSGVSKQIALLEDELGIQIFERNARKLIAITVAGEKILKLSREIISKAEDIRLIAEEFSGQKKSIAIATTHTQARYVLPVVVERFLSLYPAVNLNIQQGTPEQVAALLEQNDVDLAIATEVLASQESLIALPCYQWSRSIIIKKDHPLALKQRVTLEDIVQFPIVTYVQGFTGRYRQDEIFEKNNLEPNIVLEAVDADVIKTYVRLGLGVGIIADMAFDEKQDSDLLAIGVEHLFDMSTSYIAIKKDRYIKPYIYPFIEMFAPHLTHDVLVRVLEAKGGEMRKGMLENMKIPRWVIDSAGKGKKGYDICRGYLT